ncbi:MAG: 16S rRNA (cytosine(1402)-N(4))-methyltransferase RsmH [Planctomycetota bacterium]|nr:16S rRNA (cytosine(1402)-N(4))-methyltransferase RsmH [Planctomycetota bacterium]
MTDLPQKSADSLTGPPRRTPPARPTGPAAHVPVLPEEVLAALSPAPGMVYCDATAGLGGHASLIAPKLIPGGTVILNDVDPSNLERASARVRATLDARPGGSTVAVRTVRGNFARLPSVLGRSDRPDPLPPADLFLADLGFSSNQMDTAERGFSFMREGPLDMRLDPTLPVSARDLVNTLPERELVRILREYGEEPAASRIARKIAQTRSSEPITTTSGLADLVRSVLPTKSGSIDPATRTFQALRLAVNDELGTLAALLDQVERTALYSTPDQPAWLRPDARVAVIAFHSLEDRPVKRLFAALHKSGRARFCSEQPALPTESEVGQNPRSRSAKLRAVQLTPVRA